MITEKGTMQTEVIFNDAREERYLLRKIWDKTKPKVSLLMIQAGAANAVDIDMTCLYCIRNLNLLGYGGFDVLNISSKIETKLSTKDAITLSAANVEQILKSASMAKKFIICWGKIGENNAKVKAVQRQILEHLQPFEDKLHVIASPAGGTGFHPLAPQIRFEWIIEKFVRPSYLQAIPEAEIDKNVQHKPLEQPDSDTEKTHKTTSNSDNVQKG